MSAEARYESRETPNGREFHLGDILSITTGRLVSPRHVDGVYDLLNFMTGDNLYTHQLPRASDECKPYLLMEMPWLGEIDASNVNSNNWQKWLKQQVEERGEYHEVRRIHQEDHEVIDPIDELRRMGVDESKIITIDTSKEEPISPYGDINFGNKGNQSAEEDEDINNGFSPN